MKKSFVLFLCLILVSTAFLSACGSKDETQPEVIQPPAAGGETSAETEEPVEVAAEPSGMLTVGITEASGAFSPLYYTTGADGDVVNLVFEGLIERNFDGEYEALIAENWEYSEDGREITFFLRQDKVFSDGQPVTAHDVEFTYLVLADPSYTGRFGTLVRDMKGYEAYYAGETDVFEGVEVLDDFTVKFLFTEPLRVNISNCAIQIVPKHYYGVDFELGSTLSVEALSPEPLGSGPYVIEQFRDKELVYLTRNPLYVGEGYMIQDIVLKFVELSTDIIELTTGNIDLLIRVIEPSKIAEGRNNGFNMNSYNRSGYGYVNTNHEWGPTSEKLVRQALYYAFNTQEFVDNFFYDVETDTILADTQFHPFSQVSWVIDDALLNEMVDYSFDLEKAKELLEEAGWLIGSSGYREKDGKVMELNVAAMPEHDLLDTLIPMWERDWGQGLGIKLNIAYLEFNTIIDYVFSNSDSNVDKWSLFFLATDFPSPDPHSIYSSFHSDFVGNSQNNTSRYKNPEVDRLLDVAKAIMDVEEAKPVYAQVAKILSDDAVMMPVYANTIYDLYHPKLVDFETSSLYDWVRAMKDAKVVE